MADARNGNISHPGHAKVHSVPFHFFSLLLKRKPKIKRKENKKNTQPHKRIMSIIFFIAVVRCDRDALLLGFGFVLFLVVLNTKRAPVGSDVLAFANLT